VVKKAVKEIKIKEAIRRRGFLYKPPFALKRPSGMQIGYARVSTHKADLDL